MRRPILAVLCALLAISIATTTVFAGKVHFSGIVSFSLGSLIADGRLAGLGREDVTVTLQAQGVPTVTCTNKGGTQAPGRNPSRVDASGVQYLASASYDKNGSTPFNVETNDPTLTAKQAGCPNGNWSVTITSINWTNATITVTNTASGIVELKQDYTCITSGSSVSCTPVS